MDMENKNKIVNPEKEENPEVPETTKVQDSPENTSEDTEPTDKVADEPCGADAIEDMETKHKELNDSYLRLRAEFDNYRKRTLREKADLIKSGGEAALTALLPVIDDFERALENIRNTEDLTAVIRGIELIYNKFVAYLQQQGVKPIETAGKPFDTAQFEAIATIPAPDESQKGTVLDCVQTGYVLYEKVIIHAKVVVGE
jgi:molecular chaperone GrpE